MGAHLFSVSVMSSVYTSPFVPAEQFGFAHSMFRLRIRLRSSVLFFLFVSVSIVRFGFKQHQCASIMLRHIHPHPSPPYIHTQCVVCDVAFIIPQCNYIGHLVCNLPCAIIRQLLLNVFLTKCVLPNGLPFLFFVRCV